MYIKQAAFISVIIFLGIFSLGMAPRVDPQTNLQLQDVLSRSIADQMIQEIESAYAREDLEGLMNLLDNNFEARLRFQAVLKEYFLYVDYPHIHFVIDMLTTHKDKLTLRVRWLKKARTTSGVVVNMQGSCIFDLKKRPSGLKIMRIERDNPFF